MTHAEASASGAVIQDPLAEATRVLRAAERAGLLLRATGGVGIALLSPSAHRAPLRRTYQDLDFFGESDDAHRIADLFASVGYLPEEEFNVLHGQRRLFFRHPDSPLEADVFLDRIEMCHELDLRGRLAGHALTVSPADLLLSKLQVMETNAKDVQDTLALLADHPLGEGPEEISLMRIDEICTSDWGWWRTATLVAERARTAAGELASNAEPEMARALATAVERIDALVAHLADAPKSRRWSLRARIGERKRWYETPEDIDHQELG